MIKLVLCDMDGTLVPVGRDRVSQRALAAIKELRSVGIEFGLATGRDTAELRRFFAGDETAFGTGIVANGMKVLVDGQVTYLTLLENESLQRLAETFADIPGTFLNLYPNGTDDPDEVLSVATTREEVEAFFEMMPLSPSCTLVDRVPDGDFISATIACSKDDEGFVALKRRAKEIAPCFDYLSPFPHWADVLPAGVNKGAALPRLLEALNITADEVLFFGDADNDLPIMGALDNTVAMANAMPAAAAAARWHVGASEDEGVAVALEELGRAVRVGETPSFTRD